MSTSKAQESKSQGNEAFKAGDYVNAIGFYTSAILENSNEPTYFLNRAASYLKLGKNEDAERDCTTVLKLSPKNMKALFRRGQARMALDRLTDAQKDFMEALGKEPNNEPVREALVEAADRIEAKKDKIARTTAARNNVDPNITPKRRRVPIKIVEPSSAVPSQELNKPRGNTQEKNPNVDTLEAVSSRPLKSNSILSPATSLPKTEDSLPHSKPAPPIPSLKPGPIYSEKPSTFQEAKEARNNARPTRVGGGIFRAAGSSQVFPTRDTTKSPSAAPLSSHATQSMIKAPETLFELVRVWGTKKSPKDRWIILETVPPLKFPALCKTSLEPSFLVSLLETFQSILETGDLETQVSVKEYMDSLADVPRFSTIVLFLSKAEKDLARDVWRRLGVEKPKGAWGAT